MNEVKPHGSFIKKFKHQSKGLRIFFLLIGLIYLVSLIFFSKSVLSLKGIETVLRALVLAILYLLLIAYFFGGVLLLFTQKKKSLIVLMIVTVIITPILGVGSYYIDKTYGIIDRVQKKYVEYTSYMVALKDTNEYKKIGMISKTDDPTGYIIPKDIISEKNIKAEIVEYDDYISMVSDLYDKKIDAFFVSDNYVTMFNSIERFESIENETKVVYELSKKLENADQVSYSTKRLTEPFTMLLMGVDATGEGLDKAASFNGDTLMLITFNPNTLSATIFSIPRDTFVPISCYNNVENKINSSAYGGTTCVVNTIQNLTGIPIDYYVKINFNGVVKLVDDLGGVEVDVPITFCEQDSMRRKKEHLICINKGKQVLNGEQALAFSRHRKTLPLGDFQRVQHQQMVVEAMMDSVKNIKDVDSFYKILDDASKNVDTNMTTEQILSLYDVGKNVLLNKLNDNTKLSIEKTYLTGYDLYAFVPSMRSYVYTFQYYKQSLADIVHAMKVNLELESPTVIKTFDFSANKEYTKTTIGKTYYNEEKRSLLPNFVGKDKAYVESYAKSHNLEVTFEEVSPGANYDPTIQSGLVSAQSVHHGIIVDTIKSVTIYINKNDNNNNVVVDNDDKDDDKQNEEEKIPSFIGMNLTEFNKWKSNLKNANIVIDTKELDEDSISSLGEDLKDDTIYKQSVKEGTKLSEVTSLTVYYYKEKA